MLKHSNAPTSHQLTRMLEMQDLMNARVDGQWVSARHPYLRAVVIEAAEAIEHHGWKWWKKQALDTEQVKLELVDIWHFGLSILLLGSENRKNIASDIAEELSNGKPSGDFRLDLEAFTLSTLKTKGFDIKGFSALMSGIDLTFEDLYVSYISKNVLNFFRQDNGYQDGSYKKVWSGKEDNEHLVELVGDLDKNSKNFKDNLYNSLQVRYTHRGL